MNKSDKATRERTLPGKCVLLIIDGLGDLPVAQLDGQTPLEAANTPVLDQMAGSGLYGLIDPIIPGEIPNTHSGTGMIMGLLPEQADLLKRGPVEAAGAGRTLEPGEVAVRANFATLEYRAGEFLVIDRRAGRINDGAKDLAASLTDVDLGDGIRGSFISTDQHRGVLILSGPGLSASVTDTDPGDRDLPAAMEICRPLNADDELAAVKINRFVIEAHKYLRDHPINIARVRNGQFPANGVITRGAGSYLDLDNKLQDQGISAAMVSGCNTVRGLSRIFGFDVVVDSRFTASLDTDLDAKIKAVRTALSTHDMVFVHVKAPDICSHDRNPLAKRDFLQRLDASLEPLLKAGVLIAVGADHTTDSNTGRHTADPVPALIFQPGSGQVGTAVKFGESQCRSGNLGRLLSSEFLSQILRTMH